MNKSSKTGTDEAVVPVELRLALEERYLAYALSTIMHRALPDVRDGLKPVHRRILYAMRQMRLLPAGGHKKSAKVVGEVMGNFHPHGDQAIYDALVRLAQDFSVRYPLVDGQGNFGNVDGDNAAAMRYTEARLTAVASLLLEGFEEDAVDYRATYDGEGTEPVVLPGAFPNLLANGATGIAVGMATSIPPHNVAELCDAALALIDDPETGDDALLGFVKGPDFPTGGVIVSAASEIAAAYRSGRGAFRVRARWRKEDTGRGTWNVVVTEIPYQVQKSRLIEDIAALVEAKKLPLLADLRDESTEDVRIVFEPRSRTVDPALLMETLFRTTALESRIPLNMNVLSGGQVPRVMGLKEVLVEWLAHRKDVLVRRSRHRLKKALERLEVLEGFLLVFLNLDAVIRIIREADDPKRELMAAFALTEVQANAILDLRLRALRRLEEIAIRKEHAALAKERDGLERLLASGDRQWKAIAKEIAAIRAAFAPETKLGARRTGFAEAPAIDIGDMQSAMVEKEPVTVVLSKKGWVRALKGHGLDRAALAFKEGDGLAFAVEAQTTDRLLFLSASGRFFTLDAARLPGGRGHGEPMRLLVDLTDGDEIVALLVAAPEASLVVASAKGYGLRVPEADVIAMTRKGKQVLNLGSGDRAVAAVPAAGDHLAVIGSDRKLLIFAINDVPVLSRGKGVRLQRYRTGALSDLRAFSSDSGLTWTDAAGRKHSRSFGELAEWIGLRGQTGGATPSGFPRSNRFDG